MAITINGQPGQIRFIDPEDTKTVNGNTYAGGGAAIQLPEYSGTDTAITAAAEKIKDTWAEIKGKGNGLGEIALLFGVLIIAKIIFN